MSDDHTWAKDKVTQNLLRDVEGVLLLLCWDVSYDYRPHEYGYILSPYASDLDPTLQFDAVRPLLEKVATIENEGDGISIQLKPEYRED